MKSALNSPRNVPVAAVETLLVKKTVRQTETAGKFLPPKPKKDIQIVTGEQGDTSIVVKQTRKSLVKQKQLKRDASEPVFSSKGSSSLALTINNHKPQLNPVSSV